MTIAATDPRPENTSFLSSCIFWIAASLPMALLALLFIVLFTLSPARAEDIRCAGADIIAELTSKDPTRLTSIRAEADAVPNGRGIFWRVEKEGVPVSYLLGTMHLTDPRVLEMPAGARAAFDEAKTVIVESTEVLDEKKAAAALLSKPDLTMFTDQTTISGLLGKDESAKLEAGLKSRGISLAMVEKMKPWIIASFVSLPACEMARKANGGAFLDKKIAEDAVASGKDLQGLETALEQLQAMADIPVKFHLQSLIETLELGSRMDDVTATMIELYLKGEIGMIIPTLKYAAEDKLGETSDYAEFEQRIVIDRNHVMADRSAPMFAKGHVFMAVGALHLPGKEGVIELLRAKGYKLTAIR